MLSPNHKKIQRTSTNEKQCGHLPMLQRITAQVKCSATDKTSDLLNGPCNAEITRKDRSVGRDNRQNFMKTEDSLRCLRAPFVSYRAPDKFSHEGRRS